MNKVRLPRRALLAMLLVVGVLLIFGAVGTALAQDANGDGFDDEITVLPENLERISWGAIIAGSIVALMIQAAFNLLAIGIGTSAFNPAEEDPGESLKEAGTGAGVTIALSMLAAMFVGGWMASRFAGMPERLDGVLHGLIVWAIVTLITLLLLTTTIGRLVSGIGHQLSRLVRTAGRTTEAVARAAGSVAQDVGTRVGDVVQSTAHNVGHGVNQAAGQATGGQSMDNVMMTIRTEAMNMMRQAGVPPERVEGEVRQAANEVRQAAQEAAQNPQQAEQILAQALGRVFNRGQEVISQVDRDRLIDVVAQRGNMSREEAVQTVNRWEGMYNQARQQAPAVADQARQQGNQAVEQARREVERVGAEARSRVEQAKDEAGRVARETAQSTSDLISRLALAAFAAIIIGAFAAGAGGYFGAPQELPSAEVDESTTMNVSP